jgi:hypothetical protein
MLSSRKISALGRMSDMIYPGAQVQDLSEKREAYY